ncbi:NADH-quinone oxidoreductase subunit H [Halobacterium litoreum]|nr:complex I subunit 1 family protein [Halobacterium litoreum]UHH13767.1 NADH-quinone oxidoreductase subunit H [Halobacterium litoreum]
MTATRLPDAIAGVLPFGPLADPLGAFIAAFLVANFVLATTAVAGPWAKRKIAADFWGKVGPNRHGPYGVLIIAIDALRLLSKENIVPEDADRPAFDLAPLVMASTALLGFAVVPMGTIFGVNVQLADPEVGLAFVFAASSMASLGIVMAGYASNNKFSLLGGLRAVALTIAYEIPLVVTGASVVMLAGTLQLGGIVDAQAQPLFSIAGVTVPSWYAFVNPFAFVLFLVASLAEVGRNPFDLAEAPQEIVAGIMTEYSSVYFTLIYLSEFVHIFLGGAVVTTLFLGGPAGPVLPGFVWFVLKIWGVFLFTQWMRTTMPRVRVDQLIEIGWKGMLVLSFVNFLLVAVVLGITA